ncbi:reticulocyte binding protein 2b (RBP2b), pseudogene [Plasmodium ovale wallikeri]|nr:reticulocyte binding protein 2b (RBP2b), pseudogene [Plasmodium ovale wallikeri]SBT59370.1 reticulocyte binding protein 2b (RBP2b), pseudogene [Plasmodium ovale wallikeri]
MNEELSTAENAFIQKESKVQNPKAQVTPELLEEEEREAQKKLEAELKAKNITRDMLDYLDAQTDDKFLISPSQPYYSYMYYINEFKRYISNRHEILPKYNYFQRTKVIALSNDMTQIFAKCIPQKDNLIKLVYELENPHLHKISQKQYVNKKNQYQSEIKQYEHCLSKNHPYLKRRIMEINYDLCKIMENMDCKVKCSTKAYQIILSIYMLDIQEIPYASKKNFANKVRNTIKHGIQVINKIEKELKNNLTIDIIKFYQKHISYIADKYDVHLRKINYGYSKITDASKQILQEYTNKTHLLKTYYMLCKHYGIFKFSKEKIIFSEKALNDKQIVVNYHFSNIVKALERRIDLVVNEEYFLSETSSIISDTDNVIKLGENVYDDNIKIFESLEHYTNEEIVKSKKYYDGKMTELQQTISRLKTLKKSIEGTYNLNLLEKKAIESIKNKKSEINDSQNRANQLIDAINTVKNNKKKVTENFKKIKGNHAEVINLKNKMEKLEVDIKNNLTALKKLVENEKKENSVIEDINKNLEYIAKSVQNIKQLITTKEKVHKNISEIEELMNNEKMDSSQFTNRKKELEEKVEKLVAHFYNYNLQEIVENMSDFVGKYENLTKKDKTKNQMDSIVQETQKKCDDMKQMKCDSIPEILTNIETELSNFLKHKKEIIDGRLSNMQKEISNIYYDLTGKYNHLTDAMNTYKGNLSKLEEYKSQMIQRKNKFIEKTYENDEDVLEGKNAYTEFTKYKVSLLSAESTMSNDISTLKSDILTVHPKLPLYHEEKTKLELNAEKKNTDIDDFLRKFDEQKLDDHLNKYEEEFNQHKNKVNKIIEEIEILNKNIDTIKTLNATINKSKRHNETVQGLKKNKQDLTQKINSHIESIKQYKLIDEIERTKFETAAKTELANVEDALVDTLMDKLTKDVEEILSYSNRSKDDIEKQKEIHDKEIEVAKTNWNSIESDITKLKSSSEVLNKKVEDLINDQHGETISLIDKIIEKKGITINDKAGAHMKALAVMQTRLNSIDFNKYNKKSSIKERLETLKPRVEALLGEIKTDMEHLSGIISESSGFMRESTEQKTNKNEFNTKKNTMEGINQKIDLTQEKVSKIKSVNAISPRVDNKELEYEKILIDDIIQQINEENEKSKKIMEEINTTVENIKQIKNSIFDEEQKKMADFDYEKYHDKVKFNNSTVDKIVAKNKEIKGTADQTTDVKKIRDIKNKVNGYMTEAVNERNSMQQALEEIKNMKEMLLLDNINKIIEEIEKYTTDAGNDIEKARSEIISTDGLMNELKGIIDKAKEHKNEINESLDDSQIDAKVKEIEQINEKTILKKEEINKHLNLAEKHRIKLLSDVHNVNRGKDKIDILQKHTEKEEYILNDSDKRKITDNTAKCKQYASDNEDIEKKITERRNLLLQYREDISTVLNASITLNIKSKSQKRKTESLDVIEHIKKTYLEIKKQLTSTKQKMSSMNEEYDTSDVEDFLNNEKSSEANTNINYNLGRVEKEVTYIKDIEQSIENILSTAEKLKSSISEMCEINQEKPVDDVREKEGKCVENLSNIKKQKELIDGHQAKLKDINSTAEQIENELKENKRKYEIGLLEKLKGIVVERKSYIDKTEKSLTSSLDMFTALFNGFDLKQHNIKKNLESYKKKITEINSQFNEFYNSIVGKATEVLSETVDYAKAKELRKAAQTEYITLTSKEEEAKKYLSDVEKTESFRLIYHLKERLVQLNNTCKLEYAKVNENHKYIKVLIEDIKKSDNGSSSLEKLKQTTDKNNEIQNISHYVHMNEAQILFKHIVKSAHFSNIKILVGEQELNLDSEVQAHTKEKLKFKPENTIKLGTENLFENKNELDAYDNVQKAYESILEILEYSKDIDAKIKESQSLTKAVKSIFTSINSKTELLDKLNAIKLKSNNVSNKIAEAFNKYSNLNKVKCSIENYDNILEKSKYTKLKELCRLFTQKRSNNINESKLTQIRNSLDNHANSINSLITEMKELNASDVDNEIIQKKMPAVDEIQTKIEAIDNEIIEIIAAFDVLLKDGKDFEVFMHTSIEDDLNAKITNDLEAINKKKKKAHEYLEYVKNAYSSINNDINALNGSFDTQKITNYALTSVEEANKLSDELNDADTELDKTVKKMRDEFAAVNEEHDISALQNSVDKLKTLYTTFNTNKSTINEIFKKINSMHLEEMKKSSNKYSDIVDAFGNVVAIQKERLIINKKNVESIKQTLREKENELTNADNTFKLDSINKFDELYNGIMANIQKLEKFEKYNSTEDQKVKIYVERSSELVQRNINLLYDVNNFEKNDELMKENKDMLNAIDDIKADFSRNIPARAKLSSLESNFNEIKSIFSEMKNDYVVDEYIEKISKIIDDKVRSSKDLENVQELTEIINTLTNYRENSNIKLQKIKNVLERIQMKKKEMDTLFSTFSTINNIDSYNSGKKYVDDSEKIINELQGYIRNMTTLVNKIENEIPPLESKKSTILSKLATDNSNADQSTLLNKSEEHTESTKTNSNQEIPENESSDAGDARGRNRLAGGIIVTFLIFSGVALSIYRGKNEEEEDTNIFDKQFDGTDNINFKDKEEVIEICFNDSDDSS